MSDKEFEYKSIVRKDESNLGKDSKFTTDISDEEFKGYSAILTPKTEVSSFTARSISMGLNDREKNRDKSSVQKQSHLHENIAVTEQSVEETEVSQPEGRLPTIALKSPFTKFYTDNFLQFKRLAFLMLNNMDVAEDIVQDSFLALYSRYARLDNPGGYLRVTVVNKCKTALRKKAYDNKKLVNYANSVRENERDDDSVSDFLGHLDKLSV